MHYMTAGESHGPQLTAIVDGVPAGLRISEASINADLARRQSGYGRGGRMGIESDTARIVSGVRFGRTLGSPIALVVENRDWQNWAEDMTAFGEAPVGLHRETTPRPGHADLVGALKIDSDDCRDVLERASARETAARVAAAGIAREFLADLGVDIFSYVTSIGQAKWSERDPMMEAPDYKPLEIEISDVRCPNEAAADAMRLEIDKAIEAGESLGGTFRVVVRGVEFGLGFEASHLPGSQVHDQIELDRGNGFTRMSNNAGGLEGGMTTGMPLIVTCAMKPIPTLGTPLQTIDLDTLEPAAASTERSDVCAVPACAVVAESEIAFELANAYLEKFGHDNMTDIRAAVAAYKQRLRTAAK